MDCPNHHKINRKEIWRAIRGNVIPANGEDICVTCGKRRIYDKAFLDTPTDHVKYFERINGNWYHVSLEEMTWGDTEI